jgi:hypothetical protein
MVERLASSKKLSQQDSPAGPRELARDRSPAKEFINIMPSNQRSEASRYNGTVSFAMAIAS